MKKMLSIPLSLLCTTPGLFASTTALVPEGKIIDYPSVFPDVTPGAGPRVIDGCNVFLTGDYIYWSARQDNMQYASTGYSNDYDLSVNPGKSENPTFKYETGFKGGLGFNFGHDMWDCSFNYTWFQSNNNKDSVSGSYSDGLTPSFSPSIDLLSDDYFKSAKTLWQLHFNVIDSELGRSFYISKYLSLRPFIGLKGTWQNQKFANTYSGVINDEDFSYWNNMNNSLWGIGIRSGLNTSWHLSESWSLFGDLALSGLFEKFQMKRKDSYKIDDESKVSPIHQRGELTTISPILELCIGIRKDEWFFQDKFHLGVQAGWEEQIWWDQNQFGLNMSMTRGGNLVLQGLTARIRCDF